MRNFTVEFSDKTGNSVTIEVGDRVAYAYYVTPSGITGDVWLFNRVESPTEIPWHSGSEPPFLNPREFAFGYRDANLVQEEDFRVMYKPEDPDGKAAVYLKDRLVAIIWDGSRPGKSAFAKRSSPVALRFDQPTSQALDDWIV